MIKKGNPFVNKTKVRITARSVFHFLEMAKEIEAKYAKKKKATIKVLKKHRIPFFDSGRGVAINIAHCDKVQCAVIKKMETQIPNIDLSEYDIKTIKCK